MAFLTQVCKVISYLEKKYILMKVSYKYGNSKLVRT